MKRWWPSIVRDTRVQYRQGFYAAAFFVAAMFVIPLRWLDGESLIWLLPAFLFSNMQVNTYFFIAGLVLLEKGEGSLEALVVTPMRPREYLGSKVVTLGLLSAVEALIVVGFTHGSMVRWPLLLAGILLAASLFTLYGFIVAVRYDSINEYLFPSMLYSSILSLPLLDYFDLWHNPLLTAHPALSALVLIESGFREVSITRLILAVVYGLAWTGLLGVFSVRAFRRFVVAREGAR